MDREQVLAFRAARQGLAERGPRPLAVAAACPASDFQPGSALLAVAARSDAVTREAFDHAVDNGELVVAHSLRAAIHAVAPRDHALYGRALVADGDDELVEQLGQQMKRVLGEHSLDPRAALDEVTEAAIAALSERGPLDKNELHEELRARTRKELQPWCKGCKSHHVAPMLWRFALVDGGVRCDSRRRYMPPDGAAKTPPAAEAARRFLRFYGPASASDFGAWAGLARSQARRLWEQIEDELEEVRFDGRSSWVLAADRAELESPPQQRGLLLLPPRDPYLQNPNRAALAPDPELRKRLFRPVASPGAVLQDGHLAGVWKARIKGKRLELELEELGPIDREALQVEAQRVGELRGAEAARVKRAG